MTPAEAQVLLTMASAVDNRKIDDTGDTAKAWAAMLDDVRFEDAREALIQHFKTSTDYLMPVMIRTAVRKMRAKRIDDHPPLTPPPGLTVLETNQWLKEARRRIGDGETIDSDAAYELKPRVLSDLAALMPTPSDRANEAAE